jgi:hypothetical protein
MVVAFIALPPASWFVDEVRVSRGGPRVAPAFVASDGPR